MKNSLIALGRRLPARVRRAVFHYGYNIARDEHDKFAFLFSSGHEIHLRALAQSGFAPRLIVDIGANSGEWTRTALSVWPEARALMVEPNALHANALQALAGALNATVSTDLLGAEDGREVDFHVMAAGSATGSSVFPERSDVPRAIEPRRLRSLDSLLAGEPADLLKIDTQGYELEILKGAALSLPAAKAVILETSLMEINEGCPLLHESSPTCASAASSSSTSSRRTGDGPTRRCSRSTCCSARSRRRSAPTSASSAPAPSARSCTRPCAACRPRSP